MKISPIPKEAITHPINNKNIEFNEILVKEGYQDGHDLKTRTYIGRVKLADKTAQRIALVSLMKGFSTHCEHEYDCCGQIYTSAVAKKLSRNRIKLTIREYVNV